MNFKEYQDKARTTRLPSKNKLLLLVRMVLGLNGESGEIAEKIKKLLRDNERFIDSLIYLDIDNLYKEIEKELGDILWYVANTADVLGLSLDKIAKENIEKLASRKRRGKIKGSGDNR